MNHHLQSTSLTPLLATLDRRTQLPKQELFPQCQVLFFFKGSNIKMADRLSEASSRQSTSSRRLAADALGPIENVWSIFKSRVRTKNWKCCLDRCVCVCARTRAHRRRTGNRSNARAHQRNHTHVLLRPRNTADIGEHQRNIARSVC